MNLALPIVPLSGQSFLAVPAYLAPLASPACQPRGETDGEVRCSMSNGVQDDGIDRSRSMDSGLSLVALLEATLMLRHHVCVTVPREVQ